MKARPYRITGTSITNYNHMQIQFLEVSKEKNIVGGVRHLGLVTFQQTKGETEWYAMRFVADTTNFNELEAFTKIAKLIKYKTNYKTQPDEMLKVINGVEYIYCNNEVFIKSDIGKNCYDIIVDGEIYTRVVGKNPKEALAKFERFLKSRRLMKINVYSIGNYFQIN